MTVHPSVGLLLVSVSMMLTSLAMFLFPKQLRGNRIPAPAKVRAMEEQKKLEKKTEERPRWKHFPATIRRMLQNDILMCRTASSVLHLLPVAGLYTFLPKYLVRIYYLDLVFNTILLIFFIYPPGNAIPIASP